MPKLKTFIIIIVTAILVSSIGYIFVNQSLKSQLATVNQIKSFQFKNIKLELKQVKLDDLKCFLIVYDSDEWKESKVYFNCPK